VINTLEEALGVVRVLISSGIEQEEAIHNPVIPEEYQDQIRQQLKEEAVVTFEPISVISGTTDRVDWLDLLDRSKWIYWPAQRRFLLSKKNWSLETVRSIDEASDKILGFLSEPSTKEFKNRGLVIGHIQSGKTANYTALIAKAADVGYRFIIVLSGMDNALRRQTQIRLKRELIGYPHDSSGSVEYPPLGNQWHEFTSESLDGDFKASNVVPAALQGSQPVIVVVKKNKDVLNKLIGWIEQAPDEVMSTLPILVIDDEADQASVDTRGTLLHEGDPIPEDYEPPAVINGLLRTILKKFTRCAYVGYTATPFANILIAHDASDPSFQEDLYPKNFIVSLPKPPGYYGTEELFGTLGVFTGEESEGMDVIRIVEERDSDVIYADNLPSSLDNALIDFMLAGATRALRWGWKFTMHNANSHQSSY